MTKLSPTLFVLFGVISLTHVWADGDMIIRGETMRHDTKTEITTADGGVGFATAEWDVKENLKKVQAKTIIAQSNNKTVDDKTKNSDDVKTGNSSYDDADNFSQNIEWIEAIGQVQVTFPNRTMTADRCKSQGKKINCFGNVIIISGKNSVKGDKGSFDIKNDRYEISTDPDAKQQVEATLYSEKIRE